MNYPDSLEHGWLKIHRRIQHWKWFSDPKTLSVFLYLLLRANIKSSYFNGRLIRRGQVVTSYNSISAATGMSVSSARRAVENLVSTGEIKTQKTNQFNIITIVKYETYQEKYADFEQSEEQSDEQAREQDHKKNKKKEEGKKKPAPAKPRKAEKKEYIPQYWERDIPKQYYGKFQAEDDWWEYVNRHQEEVEAAYGL